MKLEENTLLIDAFNLFIQAADAVQKYLIPSRIRKPEFLPLNSVP